jgi:hypothetical protein
MSDLYMRKSLFIATAFAVSALSAQAFAECDEAQEGVAGKAVAAAAKTEVSKAVAVTGKQMVTLNTCEVRAGTTIVDYKYNFLGADGLYWVEGSAKVAGGAVSEIKLRKLSPNLADASGKAGVKLASN